MPIVELLILGGGVASACYTIFKLWIRPGFLKIQEAVEAALSIKNTIEEARILLDTQLNTNGGKSFRDDLVKILSDMNEWMRAHQVEYEKRLHELEGAQKDITTIKQMVEELRNMYVVPVKDTNGGELRSTSQEDRRPTEGAGSAGGGTESPSTGSPGVGASSEAPNRTRL